MVERRPHRSRCSRLARAGRRAGRGGGRRCERRRHGQHRRAGYRRDDRRGVDGLSPQYAAPEQFDDSYGAADDLTDVYQLGAVFYELFTGRPPFEGTPAKVMRADRYDSVPSLRDAFRTLYDDQ